MHLNEFTYDLPESLVAAFPSRQRAASRLLVVRRRSGEIIHSVFSDLAKFIDPGDLLVLNDTKVFRARLRGVTYRSGPYGDRRMGTEDSAICMPRYYPS